MKLIKKKFKGLIVYQKDTYKDNRGYFRELFLQKHFNERFPFDVMSYSKKNVLRGLHYQIKKPQAKLVSVSNGAVYDVIVDLRVSSPTFKNWFGVTLSSTNKKLLWIPIGCAHGFYVLSNSADLVYKTTELYFPKYERCIKWNDEDLSIKWNINNLPILSSRDSNAINFRDAEYFQ